MKKIYFYIFIIILFFFSMIKISTARDLPCTRGSCIRLSTTDFNQNLTSTENTAQKAFDKLDDLATGGGSGSGSTTVTGLNDVNTTGSYLAGNLLVSDGTKFDTVQLSSDATMLSSGEVIVADNSHSHLKTNISDFPTLVTTVTGLSDVNTTASMTAANVLISDGTQFDSLALSGDVTIISSGVAYLGTDSVSANELNATGVEAELEAVLDLNELQGAVTDGQVPDNITVDLATTVTTNANLTGDVTSVGNATTITDSSVQFDDTDFINTATPTAGHVWVADGTDFESVAISGDITITSAGVTSLDTNISPTWAGLHTFNSTPLVPTEVYGAGWSGSAEVPTKGDLYTKIETLGGGGGGGSTTLTGLTDVNSSGAYTAGNLIIADGTMFDSLAMSGDATMTAGGAVTVVDDSHAHVIANIDTMTSSALAGQISDETGSGLAVFATSPTLTTPNIGSATGAGLLLSGLTASEILGTDGSKNLVSLAVATYPSLNELAYVKGVTSAIQTQLNAKEGTLTNEAGLYSALSDVTNFLQTGDALAGDDITDGSIDESELGDFGTLTKTLGNIIISDGTDFESVAMSGDATINSAGALALDTSAISKYAQVSAAATDLVLVVDATDAGFKKVDANDFLSGGGAPTNVDYLVGTADATLSNEIVVGVADDTVIVGNGSTWQAKTLPDCDNATTSKLLYDQATNTYSCGTDQTGGGGAAKFFWTPSVQGGKLNLDSAKTMQIEGGNYAWSGRFGDTSLETVYFMGMIDTFSGGLLNLDIAYDADSATTGDVTFNNWIDCSKDGDSDIDTPSRGAINTLTKTIPGSAKQLDVVSASNINQNSCEAGGFFIFELNRDPSDVSGDIKLRGIRLYEQ